MYLQHRIPGRSGSGVHGPGKGAPRACAGPPCSAATAASLPHPPHLCSPLCSSFQGFRLRKQDKREKPAWPWGHQFQLGFWAVRRGFLGLPSVGVFPLGGHPSGGPSLWEGDHFISGLQAALPTCSLRAEAETALPGSASSRSPLLWGHLWRPQQGTAKRAHYFHCLDFSFFCLFRAASAAYGGSQARDQIRATVASLHHSHSHVGSKPCLQTTPQLMATPDP